MKKIIRILLEFVSARWLRKWNSREKLEKYQDKKLEKQIKYFEKKSPYFMKHKVDLNDFFMNKQFMMENFDELNTVGVRKDEAFKIAIDGEETRNFSEKYKNISVGLSSGTSGHRGMFVTTDDEQSVWAGFILAKMLPKNKLFGNKIAFFLRADNNLYKSINSFFIKLKYFDLFQDFETYVDELNNYNPTILVAPASMLLVLCKKKLDGILKINPIQIISVAEILEKKDEEFIKEVFGVKMVYQIYQATEGLLGYTCHCGSIHLNEECIKFEKYYIDEKRFYPIISDFRRKSQPFIKYKLNDILIENKNRCECGSVFTRIDKIEGRSDDIFFFKDKFGKLKKVFPDFIRRCILFSEEIREYQVFQVDFDKLEVAVLEIKDFQKKEITKEFDKLFEKLGIEGVKIDFIEYSPEKNVKLRRIFQKIKKEL